MHFVEKMLLFNREVRYKINSGSGLAGLAGSEMISSGSGSCKKFRIRIYNTGSFFSTDADLAVHFDEDSDPTFHFDADPDPTFHFDADPGQSLSYVV